METKGTVTSKSEITEVGANNTEKASFVIETNDQYPSRKAFDLIGKSAKSVNYFNIGDEVNVHFDFKSREYNGKEYHSINAYRVDVLVKSSGNNNNVTNDPPATYASEIPEQVDRSKAVEVDEKFDDQLPF
jgi:hypothetical protein